MKDGEEVSTEIDPVKRRTDRDRETRDGWGTGCNVPVRVDVSQII